MHVRSLMKFSTSAGECSSQLETAAHRNKLRVFLLFNLCYSSKLLAMKILINARHANYLSSMTINIR